MIHATHKQPLYAQLVDTLKEQIENELEPGDLMPSERMISVTHRLSRTTVRLALNELEKEGVIERHHGRGTFVAKAHQLATDLMGTYSFTDQMNAAGRHPQTDIIYFKAATANKHVAARMNLLVGEKIWEFKRLRMADGVPLMVETTCVPAALFEGLSAEQVNSKSLYRVFEEDFDHEIKTAHEDFMASIARLDDAQLLDIAEGSPVLNLTRITHDRNNTVIEYTKSVARADQFKYSVVHQRS